jgi:hypothetical protein
MPGWTNRGKYLILGSFFRNAAAPTSFYMALVTGAVVPTADTDTLGTLTEIAAGNGYTAGGIAVARNSTDFDVYTEDDTNDRALVQIKDLVWTATVGPIPASGSGARYAALTDDNVTVTSRQVIAYFDLNSSRMISDGQTLTLQDCELRLVE